MKNYPFQVRNILSLLFILAMSFFAGRGIADFAETKASSFAETKASSYAETKASSYAETKASSYAETKASEEEPKLKQTFSESGSLFSETAWPFDLNHPLMPGTENWGLGFGAAGSKPTGNASVAEMKEYNAYYMAEGEEKKIYLTFDCGYENGNTCAILDALKKHHATGTFFVVGHYLESAPELVRRMVEEGHAVGNHTYHHPDMSKISDQTKFQEEMDSVRTLFQEVTGQEMPMYYRPPQGKYNVQNLRMAKDLGYATFFWSLAYVDWNVDAQPSHEEAISKLTSRIHPGAIVLLHNTSKTNGEILDELLTKWEEMGYSYGMLEELLENQGN